MTEDTSPENLRKFLESDDPALVRMGLSMAKGAGVPEEMLGLVAGLYMWDDDKGVRGAAKSVFNKYAPDELKDILKGTWKIKYRTFKDAWNLKAALVNIATHLRGTSLDTVDLWIPAFSRTSGDKISVIYALGKIGDKRAVEPLTRVLNGWRTGSWNDKNWPSVIPGMQGGAHYGVYDTFNALGNSFVEIGEASVDPLIKALNYKSKYLVKMALGALGQIKDKRAVEPIIKKLDRKDGLGQEAAEALDKLGWKPETDGQKAAYLISAAAWESLVEWGEPAVEPLIKALGDVGLGCYEAAEALGEIGDTRAVEPLIKALSDENRYVRQHAVAALGEFGDERAVEPLIGMLSDDHLWVRTGAVEALGEFGDKQAVEPLIRALGDEAQEVRKSAAEALGKIGKPAVEPLIVALGDEDERVRESAAEALGEIGDERAVEPLIKALRDEDESVREFAVGALGKIGDERAVEPLIEALGDKENRKDAAGALDKLGWVPETDGQRAAYLIAGKDWESLVELGGGAVEHLIGALSEGWRVRKDAVEALGNIGDARAVEPLIKALGDRNKEICLHAAWALGEIGDVRAVEPLIKALSDKDSLREELVWKKGRDYRVRDAAKEALKKLGHDNL